MIRYALAILVLVLFANFSYAQRCVSKSQPSFVKVQGQGQCGLQDGRKVCTNGNCNLSLSGLTVRNGGGTPASGCGSGNNGQAAVSASGCGSGGCGSGGCGSGGGGRGRRGRR